ncbi:hypothetical protein BN2537_9857 [Streptomyces venezuelae]|nr:hypothetical protein BN2537_9857 [Streptomyces venezuelae]
MTRSDGSSYTAMQHCVASSRVNVNAKPRRPLERTRGMATNYQRS